MKTFLATIVATILFLAAGVEAATINAALQWADNSGNEDGFTMERASAQDGPFAVMGNVSANVVTFVDPNLQPATQYCYRVKAFNTVGSSGYSNVACLTTPSLPSAPGNVTVTVTLTP